MELYSKNLHPHNQILLAFLQDTSQFFLLVSILLLLIRSIIITGLICAAVL